MTRIIPDKDLEKFIQATGWIPGQEIPVRQPVNNPNRTQPITSQSIVNIDDILKGKTFFSEKKKDGNYIGLAVALGEALDYVGTDGYVATMPELISAKLKAEKSHDFWQKWYAVHTEENIGIDQKGRFYSANEPVLVVVNGGGILTPDRIMKAYGEGLISNSARYENQEFDNLLDGKLADGSQIELFSFEQIKDGVSGLPHRFGVVMPYSIAQGTKSGYHQKKDFMKNPLVIARAGGLENLESYYEMAKASDGDLGCYHPFGGRDASTPQGRVLFLNYSYFGLSGANYLNNYGRFVGVAPEAPSARK
ncbi:MAG: hypothetical protein K9N07_07745 [Candidatus Cloacimonetes bacterium]|nr:hypothetical protein [Candidatus Cloacimonadota bacterium]MCF8012779.1 hypothetical protein [Candidatus Woesearchaeota archaeon]